MRILGIDPGFERLGIAIIEKNPTDKKETVLFSECFKTNPKLDFTERLHLIGQEIKKKIKEYKPDVLAIETLFFTNNQKTVMHVAETRGVIIYEAILAGLEVFQASPLEIKMAITGYGKADKKQILKMIPLLIQLEKNKNSDDELDAIAVGLTAFASIKTLNAEKGVF